MSEEAARTGLTLQLSEVEAPAAGERPPVESILLDPERTMQLLARLPAIEVARPEPFAGAVESPPPPLPGQVVKKPFPPMEEAVEGAPLETAGPVEILRWSPQGEVALADRLSLSFNQPMVALGRQPEEIETPVTLEPQPPGRWRWMGTQTLLFEPEGGRLPMATDYRVQVPAGLRSATGGELVEVRELRFSTPAPTLVTGFPQGGPQKRQPVIVLAFDQRIDAEAVLAHARLQVGAETLPLRIARPEEIEADEAARIHLAPQLENRAVALIPVEPLPIGAKVRLSLPAGLPSAEGPRTTPAEIGFDFQVYGPLQLVEQRCGWGGDCRPGWPQRMRFSNPLRAGSFSKEMVSVEPAIEELDAWVEQDWIVVQGKTQASTTYTITIEAGLEDVFGQRTDASVQARFEIGAAEPIRPQVILPGNGMLILDPERTAVLPVLSLGIKELRVRILKVGPQDWSAFSKWKDELHRSGEPGPLGEVLVDRRIAVSGSPDTATETRVDLSPWLPGDRGQLVVWVEPANRPAEMDRWSAVQVSWVQRTRIGLSAFADAESLLAWATDLSTGEPMPGVVFLLQGFQASASTDLEGMATLPLPESGYSGLLVAELGPDVALLPDNLYGWSSGAWYRQDPGEQLLWHVFDDRHLYRPGETARVKGWLRLQDARRGGDLRGVGEGQLSWTLTDPQGTEIGKGKTRIDPVSGFDLSLDLPAGMALGHARLELEASFGGEVQGTHHHSLQVQEFRRPEFEVGVAVQTPGPHLVGGSAEVEALARYYSGGALPGADVRWQVHARGTRYTPPGREDWQFGRWQSWWWHGGGEEINLRQSFSGKTDSAGIHRLRLGFEALDPPFPVGITTEASIQDLNRQAWTGSTSLLLHPGSALVGLRLPKPFQSPDEPVEVELVVVDIDGRALPGRTISFAALRRAWTRQPDGTWEEVLAEQHALEITSTEDPVRLRFQPESGGVFELSARVEDEAGRVSETRSRSWVFGGEVRPDEEIERQALTLVPSAQRFEVGATMEVLVQSPFFPAEGLALWQRSGIVRSERFTLSSPSHVLRLPVEEAHVPGLVLQVEVVGSAPRGDGDDRRPAYAGAELRLEVPPLSRTLKVEVAPDESLLEPGGRTDLRIRVRDAAGQPVPGAQTAVVVVDEAVLALSGQEIPDPIGVFYPQRPGGVQSWHGRAFVRLGRPEDALDEATDSEMLRERGFEGAPPMMAKSAAPGGGAEAPIALRSDFSALALFLPAVPTDKSGEATVPLKLPDSLTRYRVTAVAVAGERFFGKGESSVTARKRLAIRPSPPRFLNYGDQALLSLGVQNEDELPRQVDLALRVSGIGLEEGELTGRRLTVPAKDRVELLLPLLTRHAGTARLQAVVEGEDGATDATALELPVYTPATTEAFASYGSLAEGKQALLRQPVRPPEDVLAVVGGLEISLSSTQLQALTDAVIHLAEYPYGCSEQISSRVLAIAALRPVLSAFSAEGLPPEEALVSAVQADIEELSRRQMPDGAWGFWAGHPVAWPFVTVHVVHALLRARDAGFSLPAGIIDKALPYLQGIEQHLSDDWSAAARQSIRGYVLFVEELAKPGSAGPRARALLEDAGGIEKSPLDLQGWLLPALRSGGELTLVQGILRHWMNRVQETAAGAHFVTRYEEEGDYLVLHGARRTDGILLDALLQVEPENALCAKLVEGLLGHRKKGHWGSTQEDAWVLLGLQRYFRTWEKEEPAFTARTWLGDRYAGAHEFLGRSTERAHTSVPMATLLEQGEADLVLSKEGPGRLYYRLGLRYAPQNLSLDASEQGFSVERRYEAVDDPGDVSQDADGSWQIKAGARVRVRLSMVAPGRRTHVALVDPLPAGLEPLNPELALTGTLPSDTGGRSLRRPAPGWWGGHWFEHQELRDDRAQAFTSLLPGGIYEYSYLARATTPGVFVVPPARAEEMYHPETFGRTATARVLIR